LYILLKVFDFYDRSDTSSFEKGGQKWYTGARETEIRKRGGVFVALQILLGASGAGKSHVVYERLIASAMKNPRRRHIVLVPEQFTMQTQRKLVTMHPEHGIMNIDVLSFERLAYRVFAELDLEEYAILDDAGKSMLLRR